MAEPTESSRVVHGRSLPNSPLLFLTLYLFSPLLLYTTSSVIATQTTQPVSTNSFMSIITSRFAISTPQYLNPKKPLFSLLHHSKNPTFTLIFLAAHLESAFLFSALREGKSWGLLWINLRVVQISRVQISRLKPHLSINLRPLKANRLLRLHISNQVTSPLLPEAGRKSGGRFCSLWILLAFFLWVFFIKEFGVLKAKKKTHLFRGQLDWFKTNYFAKKIML